MIFVCVFQLGVFCDLGQVNPLSVCTFAFLCNSSWLERWKQSFPVIMCRISLTWHWQSRVSVRTSCLSLQEENMCHYVGKFYEASEAAFGSASPCCSAVLCAGCSVGAVLQLLEVSGFKHTATYICCWDWNNTVSFLQIEYWPLICKQIPSYYLSCCVRFRQTVSAGIRNKLRGVKSLSDLWTALTCTLTF